MCNSAMAHFTVINRVVAHCFKRVGQPVYMFYGINHSPFLTAGYTSGVSSEHMDHEGRDEVTQTDLIPDPKGLVMIDKRFLTQLQHENQALKVGD